MKNLMRSMVVCFFLVVGSGVAQTEEGTYERYIEDNFAIKIANILESKNFDSLDKKNLESKKVYLNKDLWNAPGCEVFFLRFSTVLKKEPSKCLDIMNGLKKSYDSKKISYIRNNFKSLMNSKLEENDTLFNHDFFSENGKIIFKSLKNLKLKESKISLNFSEINDKLVYEKGTLDNISTEIWSKIKPSYDFDISSVFTYYTITNNKIDFTIYFYSSDIELLEIKDPNLN